MIEPLILTEDDIFTLEKSKLYVLRRDARARSNRTRKGWVTRRQQP